MFDLKVIHSVLDQLEEERGIPREKIIEAIEAALATAYRKDYGKKGQIVRAKFDLNTGTTEFLQVKIVVDPKDIIVPNEDGTLPEIPEIAEGEPDKIVFNPEHHILLDNARRIKKDAQIDEEIVFPLEMKDDYGRIASQTAKQVIIQKIREAEKVSVLGEFGKREGEIVSGTVQRIERGNIFIDMGRASGLLPYEEQIPGERFRQGERIRAYLYRVEETPRGIFLRLSRSHPKFLVKLFEAEAPELANGTIEIKAVAREAGSRTKIAVHSNDGHIDPVGSLVGQRGVRVSTVMSELGGEKIDIIEWSADTKRFVEDALSPAKVMDVEINEETKTAQVKVSEDQQSLAIGKGGQNVRLAAKLTGWRIDIQSIKGDNIGTAAAGAPENLEAIPEIPNFLKDTSN
jgi:transcription termination/antitermination protein NusA